MMVCAMIVAFFEESLLFSILLGASVVFGIAAYVNERESGHSDTRLRKAEERALAAEQWSGGAEERAKEKIVLLYAKIAQELRIPLSVIVGYAELIRDGCADQPGAVEEYAAQLCDRSAYMNDLITHMLLEFRTANEMNPIPKTEVDVLELLRKMANDLSVAANWRELEIKVVSECEKLICQGDAPGLVKVFRHIIENAVRYKSRNINITASKHGCEIILVFKDDGTGMGEEESQRIFELGYQGHVPGEGVGMYIVKTEVEAHGGTVFVKTQPGMGMGVYIMLPAEPEDDSWI
jgi:two-component system OmpR family sensor kinase